MKGSRLALGLVLALLVVGLFTLPARAGGYAGFRVGRVQAFRSGFYAAPIVAPIVVQQPVIVQQEVVQQPYVQTFAAPIVTQPLVGYPTLFFSGSYGASTIRSYQHGVQRVIVRPQRQRVIIRHR